MIARLVVRHHHGEPLLILDPLQLALISQKLDVLHVRWRERAASCKRLDESKPFRPPHHERIESVTLRGKTHFFSRQVLTAGLIEPCSSASWRGISNRAIAEDLPWTCSIDALAIDGHPFRNLVKNDCLFIVEFATVRKRKIE